MDFMEIAADSQAGKELARIMADKETYMIRISDSKMFRGEPAVKIKRNEGMWSPPLPTK